MRGFQPVLQIPERMDHFIQPAGVENSGVQVMRITMVPEIEPEHVETGIKKPGAVGQDVVGVDTALPAVKQHGQAAALRYLP